MAAGKKQVRTWYIRESPHETTRVEPRVVHRLWLAVSGVGTRFARSFVYSGRHSSLSVLKIPIWFLPHTDIYLTTTVRSRKRLDYRFSILCGFGLRTICILTVGRSFDCQTPKRLIWYLFKIYERNYYFIWNIWNTDVRECQHIYTYSYF